MAIGHDAAGGRAQDCEVVTAQGESNSIDGYQTFSSSTGRNSSRFQVAAGAACLALALVALVALSDGQSRTELTVEHARERMTPDASMLDRLLSREEAADKQQLASAKAVVSNTAPLSPPASLQGSHSALATASSPPLADTPTLSDQSHAVAPSPAQPPHPVAAAAPAAPHPAAPAHTVVGPGTPLHTAAERVAAKQQTLSGSAAAGAYSHTQRMGDDGWKDNMVPNDAKAQISLPGYAYFMGAKAEHSLLKSSLAEQNKNAPHVIHEDAQFRVDGGMFNDKKSANTPEKQVPLYKDFW